MIDKINEDEEEFKPPSPKRVFTPENAPVKVEPVKSNSLKLPVVEEVREELEEIKPDDPKPQDQINYFDIAGDKRDKWSDTDWIVKQDSHNYNHYLLTEHFK